MYISNEIKQISTILPKESFIYHLNYEDNDNKQNLFYYNRKENPHSYPHYIVIDKSSMRAHGIILFNSSPIKVQINQNQENNFINYKINSGDIDLFVFDDVPQSKILQSLKILLLKLLQGTMKENLSYDKYPLK